jgi:hypothetical protein
MSGWHPIRVRFAHSQTDNCPDGALGVLSEGSLGEIGVTKTPLVLLPVFSLLASCAEPTPSGQMGLLDFIQDGKTTTQEIVLHLGDPGATYENERVLTYRLGHDKGGYYVFQNKTDWNGVCSNLVLALDGNNRLRQHSLVQVGDC